jgi:DNA-binding NarL/FixJ family response regulator
MKDRATPSTVTVAVVEDTSRFSEGIVEILHGAPQLYCLGVCQTATEALAKLPVWKPDVVLLDLDLGTGRDGLDILPVLRQQLPDTHFLVLTVVDDPAAVFQAVLRGAMGYLRKSTPLAELPSAILEVHQGFWRLSSDVMRLMLDSFRNPPPAVEEQNRLSRRESEILDLLAQGYERKELAVRFNLSAETVKTHVRNIHHKLSVATTQQAVQKVYPSKRIRILPRWITRGEPLQ